MGKSLAPWLLGFLAASPAWAGQPGVSGHFRDEPAHALVRQLAPGLGLSLAVPGTSAEALASRWRASVAQQSVADDPGSGLRLVQRQRWLPELRALVLESAVANNGKKAVRLENVCVGDWCFRIADGPDALRYKPLTYRNDVWYGSTYWTGPDWTRVGKDWHHPGVRTPSVRRFTAPRDGRVTVTGRVYKAHLDGDGIRAIIRHKRRTLWQAELDGKDAKGKTPSLTLDVRKGDAIRFVVHKRGRIFCDTTRWDPAVTYADGQQFVASRSFSTKRQGNGGWSYEMETDPKASTGLPRVHAFGLDTALRQAALAAGRSVRLSHRDALPLFVVADGADRSGVAVALLAGGPWRFVAELDATGRLRVRLAHGAEAAVALRLGQSLQLPPVALAAYRGPWIAGASALERWLSSDRPVAHLDRLRDQVAEAFRRAAGPAAQPPELGLWAMVQADWRQQDKLTEVTAAYAAATAHHIEKTRQLLADLRADHGAGFLAAEGARLDALASRPRQTPEQCRSLYVKLRSLKRRIVLANPLMGFGKLLFTKRVPTSYSHLVMQYYGWRARPGGGLFVLERPGRSLAARRILDASEGCVLEPRLSYGARRIVFSFVKCPHGPLPYGPLLNDTDVGFYHIHEVGVDGTGLRQVTRGPYDDLMPTYLPDGGIAFSSTRRKGYARCFGGQFSRRWHVYALHRVESDGSGLRALSYHDTNEWFPTVSNTGHILYARWDYIDRDAVTHQNLWATRPDGTNPVALWGNASPKPHCTFQAQAIPNSSKIIFTASAHHSIAGGPICLVDPTVHDNSQDAITRITPEIPFPEAESRNIREYYTAPWPLSEKYYLVAYSPMPLQWEPRANFPNALGIYTLDRWGNRELIYRDPDIGSTNPCPLVPRPAPPILPKVANLREGPKAMGEMVLLDVYEGLGDVPRGSIKQLRIVQIFPKTTNVANRPPIGLAREENARAVLGTVPVEPDGSARFNVPARKLILFQALDKDGFAYQNMHSGTYVQPGERVACIGCHEHRGTAPPNRDALALRRPPSIIRPGPLGGRPFSYVAVVQPVLDRHCVKCHSGPKPKKGIDLTATPHKGFSRSYWSLCGDRNFWGRGTNPKNAAEALVPRLGGRHQVQVTPLGGVYGALGSRLLKMLRKGHNKVRLSPAELRRLALWIDLNAIFYGAYSPQDQARQLRGERVPMPAIQ